MTNEIAIRELKANVGEIMRKVREEGESFLITYRGRVIATVTPYEEGRSERTCEEVWADRDELALEIGRKWPKGLSAADAVREQRREL